MFNTLGAAAHLSVFLLVVGCPVHGQAPAPLTSQPPAPGLCKLTGDDEKRAASLVKAIDDALDADRWDEAIAVAEDILKLRTRVQGPEHFETVTAEWRLKALRRIAPMERDNRVAF